MQQYFAINGQVVYPTDRDMVYNEDHVSYFEKSDDEFPITHGVHKYEYDYYYGQIFQDGVVFTSTNDHCPIVRKLDEYLCIIQSNKIDFINLNGDVVHTLKHTITAYGYVVHMNFMYFFDLDSLYKLSKDFEVSALILKRANETYGYATHLNYLYLFDGNILYKVSNGDFELSKVHEFEDSIVSVGSLGETLTVMTESQVYSVNVSDNSVKLVVAVEYTDEHAYFNGRLYLNSYAIDSEGNVDYTYTFTSAIATDTYLMLGDETYYQIYDADMNCLHEGTGNILRVEINVVE